MHKIIRHSTQINKLIQIATVIIIIIWRINKYDK